MDLLERTHRLMDRDGLSQQALAEHIGVSQGHLSKMLKGKMRPNTRAMRRLRAFVEKAEPLTLDPEALIGAAGKAIRTSDDFRTLVEAALRIMQNMHKPLA